MRLQLAVLSLLTLPLVACVALTEDEDSSEVSDPGDTNDDGSDPSVPPQPLPPKISRVSWQWSGCGPSAAASPLPLSLTVHVEAANPYVKYWIKGEAVGCDPFQGNDQLRTCWGYPDAIYRGLTVVMGDGTGQYDELSFKLSDCVDGKGPADPAPTPTAE